jgi:cytochrome c-type biogenesis protein CcmE
MTRAQVEMLIAVAVALILAVVISVGTGHYLSLREKAAEAELQHGKIVSTDGIIKDGAESDERRQRVEIAVTDGRVRYREDYEREKANDPAFAERADSVVDQRVRDAARARRLARERSARADSGSGTRATEKESSER